MPARAGGVTSGLRYGVETRSAQAGDAAELARLLAVAGSAQDVAERLERIRAHDQAACFVATAYSGLSGLVCLAWVPVLHDPRSVARITALVVDAEERRRGIGRLLLKAAAQAARAAGCDVIELTALPEQVALEAFCRDTGFAPRGQVFSRVLRKRS